MLGYTSQLFYPVPRGTKEVVSSVITQHEPGLDSIAVRFSELSADKLREHLDDFFEIISSYIKNTNTKFESIKQGKTKDKNALTDFIDKLGEAIYCISSSVTFNSFFLVETDPPSINLSSLIGSLQMFVEDILDEVLNNSKLLKKASDEELHRLRLMILYIASVTGQNLAYSMQTDLLLSGIDRYQELSDGPKKQYRGLYNILCKRLILLNAVNLTFSDEVLKTISEKPALTYSDLAVCLYIAKKYKEVKNQGRWAFWVQKSLEIKEKISSAIHEIETHANRDDDVAKLLNDFSEEFALLEEYKKTYFSTLPNLMQTLTYTKNLKLDALRIFTTCYKKERDKIKQYVEKHHCELIEAKEKDSFYLKPLSVLSTENLQYVVKKITYLEQRQASQTELKEKREAALEAATTIKVEDKETKLVEEQPLTSPDQSGTTAIRIKKVKIEFTMPDLDSDSDLEPKKVAEKISDAKRLGFSEDIFGGNTFTPCRTRSFTSVPIYVVWGKSSGDEVPPAEVEEDFIQHRIPQAKIVLAQGEYGFKHAIYSAKYRQSYLYGKNGSSWRLFPIAKQSIPGQGTAYLFGEFHDTKGASWNEAKLEKIMQNLSEDKKEGIKSSNFSL